MKLILRIAQNELRSLFYAPVAWFLTIVFMALCAFYYAGNLYSMAKLAEHIYSNFPFWAARSTESFTESLYLSNNGIFAHVLTNIYLFVPLLTMNVINREFNSGTIKLLYSSPTSVHQVVFGKYLALMAYNLLLVGIVAIFVVSGFFSTINLDYGRLLCALLAFYLLLCALTSIGFFMSAITSYPIVSAIASFTLLAILSRIGSLWQEYDLVRDLTWFLSIAGRTEKMVKGLIVSRDIAYYLVIIGIFISFTILKLTYSRQAKPWYHKATGYTAVLAAGLLTGYILSLPRFTFYYDGSARKINTIHPNTQAIFKRLSEGPLTVTLYANLIEGNPFGFPRSRNAYINNMWEPYQRFKKDIEFKYEYYYDYDPSMDDSMVYKTFPGKSLPEIAALNAKLQKMPLSFFKTPEQMRRSIDLSTMGYKLTMKLEYKGRSEFLRCYEDGWPDEQNVNAAFSRLLNDEMPKVSYITGELERSIYKKGEREYHSHSIMEENRGALVNIGFDADTVNLSTQNIDPKTDILVLADPKMELSTVVLDKIRNYIRSGRNMMILGEPGKQYVLNPLLKETGVQLRPGEIVQPGPNETAEKVTPRIVLPGLSLAADALLLRYKMYWEKNVPDDSLTMLTPGVTAVKADSAAGFNIRPLALTSPGRAWLKAGKLVSDSIAPQFSPEEGDQQDAFATGIQLTRQINGHEQRIIITGDADHISNRRGYGHTVFPCYSWLCYNRFPVYTPIPFAKDNYVTIRPRRAAIEKFVYQWALPGAMLLWGTILLIRRRRK